MLAIPVADHIGLWLVNVDTSPDLSAHLNKAEQAQFARIKIPQHQQRMINARGALRQCLTPYLETQPIEIEFIQGQHGKPYCKDHPNLYFNISHSGSYALIAINYDHEIGIDIEVQHHLDDLEKIAQRVFSEEELTWLFTHTGPAREKQFFTLWTRKEAVIKTSGEGLSAPLTNITTTNASGEICVPIHYLRHEKFMLQDLELPENYCGAIVYQECLPKTVGIG